MPAAAGRLHPAEIGSGDELRRCEGALSCPGGDRYPVAAVRRTGGSPGPAAQLHP
jgi:hypothetical protein